MIEVVNKKIFIFDLDGTLAESKQSIDKETTSLLEELISYGYLVAVISGGSYLQFEKQFIPSLGFLPAHYECLYLMPTSGASLYRYNYGKWSKVYSHELSDDEKKKIISSIENAVKNLGFWIDKSYGQLIEDRSTQISYSGLGQDAPIIKKKIWDPHQDKRKKIVELVKDELSDFDIKIGGMTTIDITKKGINKAYGIKELSKILNIPIGDMAFIGDALYPGGNDESAKESGIECIEVRDVQETKQFIKNILNKK